MSRRCVFLDRDGVINVKQPDGHYVCNWSQFVFLPGIADWIKLFNALGYLVIVVTNQRGVARGLMTLQDVEQIHQQMRQQLADQGARIDDVFTCAHEQGSCQCRKPATGLIELAQSRWDIDLSQSIMIGDSPSDRQLAENCGMPFVEACQGRIVGFAASSSPQVCESETS